MEVMESASECVMGRRAVIRERDRVVEEIEVVFEGEGILVWGGVVIGYSY